LGSNTAQLLSGPLWIRDHDENNILGTKNFSKAFQMGFSQVIDSIYGNINHLFGDWRFFKFVRDRSLNWLGSFND